MGTRLSKPTEPVPDDVIFPVEVEHDLPGAGHYELRINSVTVVETDVAFAGDELLVIGKEVGPARQVDHINVGTNHVTLYFESVFGDFAHDIPAGTFDVTSTDGNGHEHPTEVTSLTAAKGTVVQGDAVKMTIIHEGFFNSKHGAYENDLVVNRMLPDGSEDTLYNQRVTTFAGTNEEEIVVTLQALDTAFLCAFLTNRELVPIS